VSWKGWDKFIPPTSREPVKASKFRNRKTTLDGETFDSAKEAKRWTELKMLEAAGEIRSLRRQVTFPLEVNGRVVARYIADAVYERDGRIVVEDTKSPVTRKLPVYRLKYKLMQACHGVEIHEV
jgi:hypothetical protein